MNGNSTAWSTLLFLVALYTSIYMPAIADSNQPAKNIYKTPSIVLATTTGIVVGTPIATMRLTDKSIKSMFHQYDGDSFSYKLWGRSLSIPVGILAGTIKGCLVGQKNAIRYTKDKPFSREAFSLEDIQ